MKRRITVTAFAVFAVALSLLLPGIGRQRHYVFDEFAYVSGARAFLQGGVDTNPEHPPLAKILIAGGMKVAGDNPVGWRLTAAICGALTVVAIFCWTYLLAENYQSALTAAAFTLLSNFLFVMARVAMLDVFYFAFVIWGVVAFTAALKMESRTAAKRVLMLLSGVMFGLGAACKWSAVVTLGAVVLAAGILYLRRNPPIRQVGLATLAVAFVLLPVLAYGSAYWPLCHRFHRPFTLQELASMNVYIWQYHVSCPGNPALDSRWYSWIFRSTPERALSYLMGNFVVVWGGFVALLFCAWRFCRSFSLAEGLITLFYAVNLLQWVIIPQQRTVYYYYYPCTMFLCEALAIVLGWTANRRVLGMRPVLIVLLAASVFFLYCYPRMAALEAPYDCALGCWI